MAIRADCLHAVQQQAVTILRNQARYQAVGDDLGIPWFFIGAIHSRECSGRFDQHLHNGDPLTARTTHVPAGRPAVGSPPFTWEESALDALTMRHWANLPDWSIPTMFSRAETYNGLGYAGHGIASPYLWSLTTVQQPGKYVKDGPAGWDPTVMDKQPGVAAILSVLAGLGVHLD
jgi:lysozyme family protein